MSIRIILSAVILVVSEGLILEGPSAPLVAQLGGVLQLPCSVDTPIPLQDLNVEWRRTDSKEVVHLFQGEESRPELQSSTYRGRAFFTQIEMARGNYSLVLRNITSDDAGSFTCRVYTKEKNGEIEAEIEAIERLVLTGTDHAVTAYVGYDVILNCFVDSHIPPEEVSWKKVESDKSPTLVLLFQDNKTYPDSAHASYQGRVEFFTTEIPKGNFSLRLKDVRTEDKGEYICEAHSGDRSANTTVVLQGLGLSFLHILLLLLCCSAIIVVLVAAAMILMYIKKSFPESKKMRKGNVQFQYSAKANGELDLVVGETIEILQKNDGEWHLGKYNGKVGYFPSNNVQKIAGKGQVLYDFKATADDELDLVFGQTIEILQKCDGGWHLGKHNDREGFFPSNYIREMPSAQGKVVKEYSAKENGELDLAVGETIEILQMASGWSLGKHNDKVGLFTLFNITEISALKDINQRALKMHYVLVFAPSILMFTAFVLWGIIEGSLGEVVTCSTLNLIRFILLFRTSLYKDKLQGMIKTIISNGFLFEYIIVVGVLYFVIFFNIWSIEGESKSMAFMGIMFTSSLHMVIQTFFTGQRFSGNIFSMASSMFSVDSMDFFYLFTVSFMSRTFSQSAFISMFVGAEVAVFSTLILNIIIFRKFWTSVVTALLCLGFLVFLFIKRLIMSTVVFYFFYQALESNEERAGLLSVTALLHLLALAAYSDIWIFQTPLAETPVMILYMFGAVCPLAVSATSLATELIQKSRKGERTVSDLRVVILPFECVFVLGWIFLWMRAYWMKKWEGAKDQLASYNICGCRQRIKCLKGDPNPPEECEMTEKGHQSLDQTSGGSNTEQGSPQEPPAEAVDIHVPGDALEDTDVFTGVPESEPKFEECPHSTETVTKSVDPLGPNVDTERYTDGSATEDISTSTLLEDSDAVSKTLLSHEEREPETKLRESRRDSITEHMESSPLLQEGVAKGIPHSESN